MSERHDEERSDAGASPRAEPEPEPGHALAAEPAHRRRRSRSAAGWLAALLILILAGVALSPFWAPVVTPLLPWGAGSAVSAEEYSTLAARVAAVEKRPVPPTIDADAVKSAQEALTRRVDQLEKRPVPPSLDADAIKAAQSALERRVDQLGAAADTARQTGESVAEIRTAIQQLDQRLNAAAAQSASRTAEETADLEKLQQEFSRLDKVTGEFAERLAALERRVQSQSGAERVDAALALLLVQIRAAVDQARPFPVEYDAFVKLATDPELAAAAKPLAEAARSGVASRAVLNKRLSELAGPVASAPEPADQSDWGAQALARLRGLVTIRRIEGASQSAPEAAISAARAALASGDLAGAVAALDTLTGTHAEAARPWLKMARQRLAVEAALDHLQELLTAHLGEFPPVPAAAPPKVPDEPQATPRTPS